MKKGFKQAKRGFQQVLRAAICCVLAGAVLMGSGCNGALYRHYSGNGYYTGAEEEPGQEVYSGDFDQEIPYTGVITKLKVEIGPHHLQVQEGTDQAVRLEAENADRVQCYMKDGGLYLKEVGRKRIPDNSQDRKLILTVPAGLELEEAVLDADMGSVEMTVLRASVIELNADMGNVEIDELAAAEKIRLSADMGNITVKSGEAAELEADADMGNIDWKGTVEGDATLSSDMGNLEMMLYQEKEGFNYEIFSDMGSIELDRKNYGDMSGTERIDHGASRRMSLNCSMGSIEVRFR